ncbi:MAG: YaiI/YqxD family protein [Candidatus Obscuribacterales bacterium]|nr:YaiI/YqxD family protein [Candidatus Obscuribacterales bacterium]
MVKIWVDADACPGAVRDIIIKAALRLKVKTIFVANKALGIPTTELFSTVVVAAGPDIADDHIAENSGTTDLVVTQDILLAARLVERSIVAINPRGDIYTEENIGERVSVRNLSHDLRETGEIKTFNKPFGDKEKRSFANSLDRELTKLLKK